MKKIFTLIAAVFMMTSVVAKDFTDQLLISLNGGEPTLSETTVTVNYKEGSDALYDIILKNFSFSGQKIGDVTVADVPGNEDSDGYVWFQTEQDAKISNGGMIAMMLGGKVHVTIKEGSFMKGDKLYLEISLPVNMMGSTINVEAVFGTKETTGISSVSDDKNAEVTAIYGINGASTDIMRSGNIYIMRMSDGRTVKMLKR